MSRYLPDPNKQTNKHYFFWDIILHNMYRKFCSVNNKKDNKLNMEYANDSI